MSDYLHALDAADSGFMNAFVGPQPGARGYDSRIGDSRVGDSRGAGESSLFGDSSGNSAGGTSAEEASIDRMLRELPLPPGFAGRMRRLVDGL